MTNPFLTIAIPTWNRYQPLQENLLSLIKEIGNQISHEIEIVISDNASTDETEFFCNELQSKHSYIRYHRNSQNLGANANFQNVIKLAHGQYVWLFGDDDLIVEGSIAKVINDIRAHNFPSILIGGAILDTTGERVHLQGIHQNTLLRHSAFARYSLVDMCGKISVLVFKKSAIDEILPLAWPIITRLNSPWPHIIWILLIIEKGNKRNILALSYGISYYISKNWHNLIFDGIRLSQILFIDTLALVKALETNLDPELYKILMRSIVKLQRFELIRCAIYATYRNGYFETIREAMRNLFKLPGIRNRMDFFVLYFLPVTLPISLRLLCCNIAYKLFPKWERFSRLITNLRASQKMSMTQTKRTFDETEL